MCKAIFTLEGLLPTATHLKSGLETGHIYYSQTINTLYSACLIETSIEAVNDAVVIDIYYTRRSTGSVQSSKIFVTNSTQYGILAKFKNIVSDENAIVAYISSSNIKITTKYDGVITISSYKLQGNGIINISTTSDVSTEGYSEVEVLS